MKLLRETIRNILMESASILSTMPVEELQMMGYIFVVDTSVSSEFTIYLCSINDFDKEFDDVTNWVGKITTEDLGKGTMEVSLSGLNDELRRTGIGALMYNVALAACTKEGLWLMADRSEVSGKASRIWDTWKDMRDVYRVDQTDHQDPRTHSFMDLEQEDWYDPDVDYFLTPETDDDFGQTSFQNSIGSLASFDDSDPRAQIPGGEIKDWWYFFDEDYKQQFLESGLTKRFKMKDPDGFLQMLKNYNLLYEI